MTRIASLLLAVLAFTAVTSCGRDTGQASASPTPSSSNAEPWDPCTIPDDAIRAAGLRTDTKDRMGADEMPVGWKMCRWESGKGWYRLSIFSMSTSFEKVKSNPDNREGRDVKIGNKTGYQFRDKYDKQSCDVAIGYGNRTILTSVLTGGYDRPGEDCSEVIAVATQFEKYYR